MNCVWGRGQVRRLTSLPETWRFEWRHLTRYVFDARGDVCVVMADYLPALLAFRRCAQYLRIRSLTAFRAAGDILRRRRVVVAGLPPPAEARRAARAARVRPSALTVSPEPRALARARLRSGNAR